MAKKKVSTEDLQEAGAFGAVAEGGVGPEKPAPKRPRRICLTLSEELSQAIREGCAELGVSISSVVADMEGDHWQWATFNQILAAEAARRVENLKRFLPNSVVIVPVPSPAIGGPNPGEDEDSSTGFGEES